MGALSTLLRLARHQRDEVRRELLAADRAIAVQQDQLSDLRAAAERERRAALALGLGDLWLGAYHHRIRARERSLLAELRCLEERRAAQTAQLVERQNELRRLEILTERRAAQLQRARTRQEQRTLDELTLARRVVGARAR